MLSGEWLTRFTIWVALFGYALSVGISLSRPERSRPWARRLWTLGLAFFLVHVAAAFHAFYGWSHAVGFAETARQTRDLTGVESGYGLYLNYLFTIVWLVDAVYWWAAGLERYATRPTWITASVHGFFLFMIVNGAVVFVHGHARWLGLALLAGLLGVWWRSRRKEVACA